MYATFVPGISKHINDPLYHANVYGPKTVFTSGIRIKKGEKLYEYHVQKIFTNWFEELQEIIFSSKDYRREISISAPLDGIYYSNSSSDGFFSRHSNDLEKFNGILNSTFDDLLGIDYAYYVITNEKTMITAYEIHETWFRFMNNNWSLIYSWLASNPNSYDIDKLQSYINIEERNFQNFICHCVEKT